MVAVRPLIGQTAGVHHLALQSVGGETEHSLHAGPLDARCRDELVQSGGRSCEVPEAERGARQVGAQADGPRRARRVAEGGVAAVLGHGVEGGVGVQLQAGLGAALLCLHTAQRLHVQQVH